MNALTPLAIRLGGAEWLPKVAPYVVGLDRLLARLTAGRVTLVGLAGLPELVLTVEGRRSGLPRSSPLLYVPHEGAFLVAGSNWGRPEAPSWVANLRAAETADVRIKGRHRIVVPREARGEERARLWRVMLDTWPNYATYAARTDREIPVFVLQPQPGESPVRS